MTKEMIRDYRRAVDEISVLLHYMGGDDFYGPASKVAAEQMLMDMVDYLNRQEEDANA